MVIYISWMRIHLKSIRVISIIGSFKGRVDMFGDSLRLLSYYPCPCPRPNHFPGCLGWTGRLNPWRHFFLDDQETSLEVLSQGHIFVAWRGTSALAWLLGSSYISWQGCVPIYVIWWLMVDPLAFTIAVFFATPILFTISGLVSCAPFWIFQNLG